MTRFKDKGILIVDDDENTREIIRNLLEVQGYSRFYEAENGVKCLSILSEWGEDIYLVLLDLAMPEMGGVQVIEHLTNVHKHIVGIIIVTGYPKMLSGERFLEMGTEKVIAADYIEKPLNKFTEFLTRVMRTIELVELKRNKQADQFEKEIKARLDAIESDLRNLDKRIPGFLSQLGLDVVRILLIAATVLAFLYLGIGDFVRKIIGKGVP